RAAVVRARFSDADEHHVAQRQMALACAARIYPPERRSADETDDGEAAMNPVLPEETLARRTQLPLKPEGVVMEGRRVRLVPLDVERDADTLFSVRDGSPITLGGRHVDEYDPDELIWRYMFGGPFENIEALTTYLRGLVNAPNGRALTVID